MRDTRRFGCSSNLKSGKHLCANDIRLKRTDAEESILYQIKDRLLTPEAIARVEK